MKHLRLYIILGTIFLSGCQRDISGTYLASDKAGVYWLQIVRTPDNHLSGQLASSTLGSDGKISQNASPITGAVNDRNVTISMSKFLGLETITLGGTLDGNKLTLSGPTPGLFVLQRADFSDYQKLLGALNAQSQSVIAAKEAANTREKVAQTLRNTISEMNQLVGRMEHFDAQADIHLARFPKVERHYQDITAKIAGYVNRERELAKNPNASVARSQLVVAAYQAAIETNQIHLDAQSLQSSFEMNVKPLAQEVKRYEEACQTSIAAGSLTEPQVDARDAACKRLSLTNPAFQQKYDAFSNGLAHLEQVYSQENTSQQELIHTGERLQ